MSFLSAIPIIGDVIKGAEDLISEAITDKDKKLELENKLKTIQLETETKLLEMEHDEKMGQVEVAKLNASSNDNYVRRARPSVLWVCCLGMAYNYIVHPLMLWLLTVLTIWYPEVKEIVPPPALDLTFMAPVLLGMLGLSTLRTTEKIKGVVGK